VRGAERLNEALEYRFEIEMPPKVPKVSIWSLWNVVFPSMRSHIWPASLLNVVDIPIGLHKV
jgi:hypothetical protein